MGCRATVRLGDVIRLEDAKREPISARQRAERKGIYPYFGAQGVVDHLNDYTYEGEYLLVAEDGENLRSRKQPIANAASGRFRVNNHAHVLGGTEKCNLIYLLHLLNSTDISGYVTGSTQPKLSQSNLLDITVALPDIDTQNAIASLLNSFDKKISLNNQLNGYLVELINSEFAKRFDNHGPKTPLKNVLSISTKSLNPQQHVGEVWEHYSIPAFDATHWPTFELADGIKSNKYAVDNNSILISKLNPSIKRMWVPACLTDKAVCSTEFIVYKPLESSHKSFYCAAINAEEFTAFLLEHVTGSTGSRQRTQPKATHNYPMPNPSRIEIESFCAFADPIYQQIQANEIESQRLRSLRDALLPKLMSGEIDVSKVDLTQLNSHLAQIRKLNDAPLATTDLGFRFDRSHYTPLLYNPSSSQQQ